MPPAAPLESVLKQDRAITVAGLAAIVGLAWAYLIYQAASMAFMNWAMAMPQMHSWRVLEFVLLFLMWAVMMVAMMVPSAAPVVLIFAAVNRNRGSRQRPLVPTGVFLMGYLAAWTVFSAVAAVVQWALHTAALLSPMMVSTSPVLGGVLLLIAGITQWTPLKQTCLAHCRSPLEFLMTEWREGARGAFLMGLRHGAYCVGCCWALMALLFVAGVMNLLWVAAIAALVLVEKVVPRGHMFGRVAGAVMVLAGLVVLAKAIG
jgi:predicted metal-binding membrane protein